MIRNYIKMKKNEWRIKATVYGAIVALINNQKDVIELFKKMYVALKDVPAEELQKEFIAKLSEIIHNENTDQSN